MIALYNFIEMLQNSPERDYNQRGEVINNFTEAWSKNEVRKTMKQEILAVVDEAKFIINDAMLETAEVLKNDLDRTVAPPFQTCWIQMPEGHFAEVLDTNKQRRNVYGIFLHEIEPHFYVVAIISIVPPNMQEFRLQMGYINVLEAQHHQSFVWDVVAAFLQPFRQAYSMGTERTHERIKYRINGEKVQHKIKKIIHITGKSAASRSKLEESRQIDWTHRWAVRGHWREVKGIGKNRAGEYVIKGFTWVEEHVKGPEDRPFVEKTRVIEADFFKRGS